MEKAQKTRLWHKHPHCLTACREGAGSDIFTITAASVSGETAFPHGSSAALDWNRTHGGEPVGFHVDGGGWMDRETL